MNLRPYQQEAIEAVEAYLAESDGNPLVVSATASGKTIIFATMIKAWLTRYPGTRIGILAHQKELLSQAADKLRALWPDAPTGFYCAGLGQKDATQPITLASIQSIGDHACACDPFDILIIDEAHLVPTKGLGRYRKFINDARLVNPHVRVIGFTATPFRLQGGYIVAPESQDHIFDHVCFETDIRKLIADGFLCPLTSKATAAKFDTAGIRTRAGDYIESQLAERADTEAFIAATVGELVSRTTDRHSTLVFCSGIAHAEHVRDALRRHGVMAETISGQTPDGDRERILREFGDPARTRPMAVTNMNVLTTGLDVTRIDCIAMLRPTLSASLYVQMVGRGFRLDPLKKNTLVLDFAGNVGRHGPVDLIEMSPKRRSKSKPGTAPTKTCEHCHEIVHAGLKDCPACGQPFPEDTAPKHEATPDETDVLSNNGIVTLDDPRVAVRRHRKPGKPDSLRVNYQTAFCHVTEWVCLDHEGYAGRKAHQWWRQRFGSPVPTVDEAMEDLFLANKIAEATASVSFRPHRSRPEITHIQTRSTEARHAQLVT